MCLPQTLFNFIDGACTWVLPTLFVFPIGMLVLGSLALRDVMRLVRIQTHTNASVRSFPDDDDDDDGDAPRWRDADDDEQTSLLTRGGARRR